LAEAADLLVEEGRILAEGRGLLVKAKILAKGTSAKQPNLG
jgi:hypothetical protein